MLGMSTPTPPQPPTPTSHTSQSTPIPNLNSPCSAIELYDRDISFLSNRAAVHFEKGDYDQCIADCDEGGPGLLR